jgi:ABC-2 type transport system ATP-binding protein
MSEIVFSTSGLTKKYNRRNAVDNVSLSVKRGDIYGFVGLNGAGKTTLMRMAAGLVNPTAGSLSIFGANGNGLSAARRRTASIIEGPIFYPGMSGRENVAAYMGLLGKDAAKAGDYLNMVRLDPNSPQKARSYSMGMKQRLAIAMALSAEAELLFLDEPTNGLDPEGMYEIRQLLKYLNEQKGVTIFISSHILAELSKLATTYGFIHYGKLLRETSAAEIESSVGGRHILETSDNIAAVKLVGGRINNGRLEMDADKAADEVFKVLSSAGIGIRTFNTVQADLEDYFRALIGGANHG